MKDKWQAYVEHTRCNELAGCKSQSLRANGRGVFEAMHRARSAICVRKLNTSNVVVAAICPDFDFRNRGVIATPFGVTELGETLTSQNYVQTESRTWLPGLVVSPML